MALTVQKGVDLAEKVRSWLEHSGQKDPQGDLADFVTDLENARNVSTWAGVDFERLLPFRLPVSARMRRASIVRNCLIFFPIIVTWASLERAISSFSGDVEGNFLEHWHGLGFPWGLGFVAWFDVGVVFLVVGLTFWVGLEEENDKDRLSLEREHSGLMAALERDLSGYRYLSIQDINLAAAGTLQSLLSSTQEIEKAANAFAESAKDAHSAISGAHQTVISVFDPAVKRLDTVIGSLGQAATVHQQMVTLVQALQTGLADQLAAIETSATRILVALDQNSARILAEIEAKATGAAQGMSTALDRGVSNLSSTAQAVSTSLSGEVRNLMDDLLRRMNQVVDGLRDVTSSLGTTTNSVMVNAATLADDLEAVHDRLAKITR